MIPKIIHYCWFGKGSKSDLILNCIESWHLILPDYRIIEWNEENFDINICTFTRDAYGHRKWAFVSDYVRLWALYKYGGVYFDTDVEVLKPIDSFLKNSFFTGFESKDFPVTAVMGSIPQFNMIADLLDFYSHYNFINDDGSLNTKPNTYLLSDKIASYGIKRNGRYQCVNNISVYPQIIFCPNNLSRIWNKPSKRSYSIHHFDQSWRDDKRDFSSLVGRIRRYTVGLLRNTIGTKNLLSIKKMLNGR